MISCDENALFFGPVSWVFELIKKAYQIDVVGDPNINLHIGIEPHDDLQVSSFFYEELIHHRKFAYQNYLTTKPIVTLENGKPDYLSSIFYLVNGFQEYYLSSNQKDKYGRLDYKHSLQYEFGVLEEDLVKGYVQKLLYQIDPRLEIPKRKSRICLSHDIDSVYGSLKYDGLWALKNGKFVQMMKVIAQTVLLDPPWFNIDKVAKLESEYDIKACYYWIVQNGRSADGIKNGDYSIENKKIQRQMEYARSLHNEMGLHKSTLDTNFRQELDAKMNLQSNRFHFLKIDNPDSFKEIEQSGIKSDSSIGFPYAPGFKNNFGMPYYPYDIERKGKINVLEIPLQIMDGMFDITDSVSFENAYKKITTFMDANEYNAIISILWHNSEMTEFAYQWSFKCYKKLLQFFVDRKFETVLPSQLVNEYESA